METAVIVDAALRALQTNAPWVSVQSRVDSYMLLFLALEFDAAEVDRFVEAVQRLSANDAD